MSTFGMKGEIILFFPYIFAQIFSGRKQFLRLEGLIETAFANFFDICNIA